MKLGPFVNVGYIFNITLTRIFAMLYFFAYLCYFPVGTFPDGTLIEQIRQVNNTTERRKTLNKFYTILFGQVAR